MTVRAVVSGLTTLARNVGIEVRFEAFDPKSASKGGLCRLRGRSVILVDANLPPVEQAGVLGEALRRVELSPAVVPMYLRGFVRTGHASVGKLVPLRPLAFARPPRLRPIPSPQDTSE